jgi:hypothetical protein
MRSMSQKKVSVIIIIINLVVSNFLCDIFMSVCLLVSGELIQSGFSVCSKASGIYGCDHPEVVVQYGSLGSMDWSTTKRVRLSDALLSPRSLLRWLRCPHNGTRTYNRLKSLDLPAFSRINTV